MNKVRAEQNKCTRWEEDYLKNLVYWAFLKICRNPEARGAAIDWAWANLQWAASNQGAQRPDSRVPRRAMAEEE